ncbi:MAG TPA: hypothetical protein ENG55_03020 [Candidatus Omnitrophica bacterium]|nr:hypothetical protein [Candidatus Omnitrophota bacterium]
MTLFAIAIPLILLIVVVEVAAIALNMTGLDMRKARFQALSAVTATGFTTEEAEDVVKDGKRRKIIMSLMIIGFIIWASLTSLIINAFITSHKLIPTIIQLSALLVIFVVVLYLARYRPFVKRFRGVVSGYLARRTTLERKSIDEVLRLAQGYGIAEISLTKDSKNVGLSLKDASFRQMDILVLAIERDNEIIPAPHANDILKENDTLICYGKLENMQEIV